MRLSEEGLLAVKWGIDSYGLYLNGLPSSSTKGILLACGPVVCSVGCVSPLVDLMLNLLRLPGSSIYLIVNRIFGNSAFCNFCYYRGNHNGAVEN